MEVSVSNRQRRLKVDCGRIAELAEWTLAILGLGDAQVSVLLVGDRKIRELNRRYRNIDKPTDVLAFSQREGTGGAFHPHLLGDVVISVHSAQWQAGRYRHSLERELDLLLVHGLLHLAGFEHHGSPEDTRAMEHLKKKILRGWKK